MLNVVLVDIGLEGHRLNFNRTFSKILLNLGCRVFLLCPGSPSITSWIKQELPEQAENFFSIDFVYDDYTPTRNKAVYILKSAIKRWRTLVLRIREIEKEYKLKIDLVFFSWMDNHLERFLHPLLLDAIFPWNWSGLYFHPYHLRRQPEFIAKKLSWRDIDSPFLASKCIGVCLHDRGIANTLEQQRYRKRVFALPETADSSKPDENNRLACQIRSLARGRIVVGIIGCEPHKGVEMALDLARLADPEEYFFVFLGQLNTLSFDEQLRLKWNEFFGATPDNCLASFGSIDEGPSYNAVFTAIDVHFMVYVDFVSSSNRLTKAAMLSRLVLASDQYCIGDDVKLYKLGEVVPPGDLVKAIEGLDKLKRLIRDNSFPLQEWIAYSRLNSEEELVKQFASLVHSLSQ